MRNTLLTTIICCCMIAATAAFGQGDLTNVTMTFNDNSGTTDAGTYNPSQVFTIDVFLSWEGGNSPGFSYWLEVANDLASDISITDVTYFTFTDPNELDPDPAPFDTTTGASSGFMAEERDLAGTSATFPDDFPPGSYKVTTLEFTLSGAMPGTYIMQSTTTSPKTSEVTDADFDDNNIPAAQYTITIVPEPSTLALLGLTAVGGAYIARRRRALLG